MKNILVIGIIVLLGWFIYETNKTKDEFKYNEYINYENNFKLNFPPNWSESAISLYQTGKLDIRLILTPTVPNNAKLTISEVNYRDDSNQSLDNEKWNKVKFKLINKNDSIKLDTMEMINNIKVYRIGGIKNDKYIEYNYFISNNRLFQISFSIEKNVLKNYENDKENIIKNISKNN